MKRESAKYFAFLEAETDIVKFNDGAGESFFGRFIGDIGGGIHSFCFRLERMSRKIQHDTREHDVRRDNCDRRNYDGLCGGASNALRATLHGKSLVTTHCGENESE